MSRNNKRAGNVYEIFCRNWFRKLGFEGCETSRFESKKMDNQKIDLCNTGPFDVQCKYTQSINMHLELLKMKKRRGQYKVLFHKRKNLGTVVAMPLKDFEDILKGSIREGVIKTEKYEM